MNSNDHPETRRCPAMGALPVADRRGPRGLLAWAVIIQVFVLLGGRGGWVAVGQEMEVLTRGQDVVARAGNGGRLTNAVARLRGLIVFPSTPTRRLYVESDGVPLQVNVAGPVDAYRPGQLVDIEGAVEGGLPFPHILDATVHVVAEPGLPPPIEVPPGELAAGRHGWSYTRIRAVVRDVGFTAKVFTVLATAGGRLFEVTMPVAARFDLPTDWVDAEVELQGMSTPLYSAAGHVTGFRYSVYSMDDIRVLSPGVKSWEDRPLKTIAEVAAIPEAWRPRHRFRGTVLVQRPAGVVYVQDATGVMLVILGGVLSVGPGGSGLPHDPQIPRVEGDEIEVIGARHNWYSWVPTVLFAEYRKVGRAAVPDAVRSNPEELRRGALAGRVVSVDAQLMDRRSWMTQSVRHELLMLQAGDDLIQASWDSENAAEWHLDLDTHFRVTGVLEVEGGRPRGRPSVQLLLRGPSDVVMIAPPPPWHRPRVVRPALAGLGVGLVAVVGFAWQRRQMRRLRASEYRFRTLIEDSFDATLVVDAGGRIRYLSPSARRMFGVRDTEGYIDVERISGQIHPDDAARVESALVELRKTSGNVCRIPDCRLTTPGGAVRHVEAIGKNCLEVPGVWGTVFNVRDITDRRAAEDEIERRRREQADLERTLEVERELSRLRNGFVSMVSHEFRTPLEVILSSSNILERYLDRLTPERRQSQVQAIRRSVQRMTDLIDDVLMLAKFEGGVLACHAVPMRLNAFCRRTVGEIESATGREGAVSFQELSGDDAVFADEGLLHHIVANLLGNAVKYSPAGSPVEFVVRRSGDAAELEIRDRGRGIPVADQARLFQSFHRGSNVGDTPGNGLGLAIVRRCVEMHGGAIRFESREQSGTTFVCRLPLFRAPESGPRPCKA